MGLILNVIVRVIIIEVYWWGEITLITWGVIKDNNNKDILRKTNKQSNRMTDRETVRQWYLIYVKECMRLLQRIYC